MEIGLLVIRVTLGAAMGLQGLAKLTRSNRRSTATYFAEMGFRPGVVFAVVAGATELAAGVLLGVGFLTPVAVAGLVGVLASAAAVNWSNGWWSSGGGAEYPAVLAAVAAAVAFTGPGDASIDGLLGWGDSSAGSAVLAIGVGMTSAASVLVRRARQQRSAVAHGAPGLGVV